MAIAYPITQGKNVLSIYDKQFDDLINYQIILTDKHFCFSPVVVDVEGVFLCDDYAKLIFTLPCLPQSQYVLKIINKDTQEEIYQFNSIYQ
jgi:hypothetical protein